ncbi:DNA translocase FtsK 4TM domain-containing protein, partial [Actinomadura sp. CNU-125]|uniref:DNA translocase FtsK 4TM domain-containing protein n=1 Tax=Actinomadura sp. CNU-125 TaxID=1904961 RepID=UPI0021CCFD7A
MAFLGFFKLLLKLWQLAAVTVGSVFRAYGHGARNLDPEHRRDGLGLALLGSAIVVASVTWFRPDGVVTVALEKVIRGGLGIIAMGLPVLLGLLAWRTLRHPEHHEDTGRIVIGITALGAGVLGILHLAAGVPSPADDMAAVREAGGVLGWIVSAPLDTALSGWVAVPLLLLLSGFGLLVVTATPINRVPDRLAELWSVATLQGRPEPAGGTRDAEDAEETAEEGGAAPRKRRRKKAKAGDDDAENGELEVGEHSRPYDSPLLDEDGGSGTSGRAGASGKPAPTRRDLADELFDPDPFGAEVPPPAPPGDDDAYPFDAPADEAPAPGPDAPGHDPSEHGASEQGASEREIPDPTPAPRGSEQLPLSSSGEIYLLPEPSALRPGSTTKPRTKANDTVVN